MSCVSTCNGLFILGELLAFSKNDGILDEGLKYVNCSLGHLICDYAIVMVKIAPLVERAVPIKFSIERHSFSA